MNGQTQINQNTGKTEIYLTTDEMVGLVMEWAESFSLPDWMEDQIKRMQDKYDYGEPTEEEKIRWLAAFVYGIPNGFYVKDVVEQFLQNYRGDDDE